jgi:formamidopyrimidine-DNA glycosylase
LPELPEVETVRDGLDRHVVGRTIESVEVLHPRVVRRDLRGPAGFADVLVGRRVVAARRRGKYLWLPLDNGDALLGHLGMSGQLLVQPPGQPDERHLRVRFGLSSVVEEPAQRAQRAQRASRDPDAVELRFVDQRMFGGLAVSEGGADLPREIAHIARDPFDPEFDDAVFVRRVRGRQAGIKRLLLDQTLVSGVGNIYADEALWRARIHGDRPGERLRPVQVREVLAQARGVMAAALRQGGTSFDALYVDVNGDSGYFDRSLHAYGRAGDPCDRCGTPIRRVEFMNRSSYFCPACQPVPRRRRVPPGAAAGVTRD